MVKKILKISGFLLAFTMLSQNITLAQGEASFKSRCLNLPPGYPPCASSPAECASSPDGLTPFNCIYLQEPIGGRPGYDLYKVTCIENPGQTKASAPGAKNTSTDTLCHYILWRGEALIGQEVGPVQALLSYESGKENQGPFTLMYNYLSLVYNFLSGLIVGVVVLIVIIGGVTMSTSAGNQEAFGRGKSMIIKALVGMVLWFTASVILYTINPTFFTF